MTLDHVDPDNKISEVNRKTIHSTQFDWRVEIQKCQLLCFNDHALKTHMVDDYLEPFDYMSGSYPGNKKLFRQRLDKGC
jgi:hypothetical protein